MERTATVVFDGLTLRPEGPIDMKPNVRYRIVYDEAPEATSNGSPEGQEPNGTSPPTKATATDGGETAWDVLDRMIGSVEMPPDWSSEHDHYLYGTPKRAGRDIP